MGRSVPKHERRTLYHKIRTTVMGSMSWELGAQMKERETCEPEARNPKP